ncbi:hypothetical protein EIN_052350 [Entamoeba invadens IP1]|uniref:hypothetical protein n=1 Tax=Entamoeba invadens IP1 TaxID=370355 RepID=UPI0002C3D2E1|nr:hypothetical protein EIN_052350 [Entamoeba invadens IP1]ELP93030.1 hypothetical protein EIN_052350 [Entamoeba invadens IP1]|eukprot:XP_004259801.1 hypothetical protein EIN_052350 [Entamoeba invadens IP1]
MPLGEETASMLSAMTEIVPILHAALLKGQSPHVLDTFVSRLALIKYNHPTFTTTSSLVSCYTTVFSFWKEMNKALSYGYSEDSTMIALYHITSCVSLDTMKLVSVMIAKHKSPQLFHLFMTYKTFCIDTFVVLTKLLRTIIQRRILDTLPLMFAVIYGELLVSLSYSLPSLRSSFSSLLKESLMGNPQKIPERVSSPIIDADTVMKNDQCYIMDNICLEEIHFFPFHSNGQRVACLLRGSLLFASESHKPDFLKTPEFVNLFDEFLIEREKIWRSEKWRDITFFMCEDVILRRFPYMFNSVLKMYSEKTNMFNIPQIVFLMDHLKKSFNFLSVHSKDLLLKGVIDARHLMKVFQICINADNGEALTIGMEMLVDVLPSINNEIRKEFILSFLLGQHFMYFFTHWCDAVRNGFHIILLYFLTLGRFSKLDCLSQGEMLLYKERCVAGFNSLQLDCSVVKKLSEKLDILREVVRVMPKSDKNAMSMKRALEAYDKKRREYDLWADNIKDGSPMFNIDSKSIVTEFKNSFLFFL